MSLTSFLHANIYNNINEFVSLHDFLSKNQYWKLHNSIPKNKSYEIETRKVSNNRIPAKFIHLISIYFNNFTIFITL